MSIDFDGGHDGSANFNEHDYLFNGVEINGDEDPFLAYLNSDHEADKYLAPPTEKWEDVSPGETYQTKLTIDESKREQWDIAKEEIRFVRDRLKALIHAGNKENDDQDRDVTIDDVVLFTLGPDSDVAQFFKQNLEMSSNEYLQFISLICTQAAYQLSSTQLFSKYSLVKHDVSMSQARYNELWSKLANVKRIGRTNEYIPGGRREKCLWEQLEDIVNDLFKSISVENRPGRICIALDDDKIWVNLSGRNKDDFLGVKYTRHNRANRNGLNGHAAFSTGANMPLNIQIERIGDTTAECFERLLKKLFQRGGKCDLRNVLLASDRGYMLPSTVFNFLIANGADFVGTTKRTAQCWPFTYEQRVKTGDPRRKLEVSGPATLFVKKVKAKEKRVFAIAFRNGSQSISTAVSSIHKNHHWEGIVLKPNELKDYEDGVRLRYLCFDRVVSDLLKNEETEEEKGLISNLMDSVVDVLTIRQGKD